MELNSLNYPSSTFISATPINVKLNRISLILHWANTQILSTIAPSKLSLSGNMSTMALTSILQNLLNCFLWWTPSFSCEQYCSFSQLMMLSKVCSLKNLSQSYSFVNFITFAERVFKSVSFCTPRSSKKYTNRVFITIWSEWIGLPL